MILASLLTFAVVYILYMAFLLLCAVLVISLVALPAYIVHKLKTPFEYEEEIK